MDEKRLMKQRIQLERDLHSMSDEFILKPIYKAMLVQIDIFLEMCRSSLVK